MAELTLKNGSTAVIRSPRESDLVASLKFRNDKAKEGKYTSDKKKVTTEAQEIWLENELGANNEKRKVTLFAFSKNLLVALASVSKHKGYSSHIGTLSIWIEPEFRGLGLGTALISEITTRSAGLGIKIVKLSVRSENKVALALYTKSGFKEYGTLPNGLIVNGRLVDNVLMYKELK